MIQLKNISMDYTLRENRIRVLSGVDLTIGQGERVAVVGPSGCGKTTLLLLLAGLERPSSGSVYLAEQSLAELSSDQLADLRRDRIGIIFQSFHLVPSLTALENVALPLEIAGQGRVRNQAVRILDRVGLGERLDHYPAQLSGGEQQRVAIARALVHEPLLVLADEPTGNLDEQTGAAVSDVLMELNLAMGSTLLLVTHDVELAGRCDRILRLHEGRLSEQSTAVNRDYADA